MLAVLVQGQVELEGPGGRSFVSRWFVQCSTPVVEVVSDSDKVMVRVSSEVSGT